MHFYEHIISVFLRKKSTFFIYRLKSLHFDWISKKKDKHEIKFVTKWRKNNLFWEKRTFKVIRWCFNNTKQYCNQYYVLFIITSAIVLSALNIINTSMLLFLFCQHYVTQWSEFLSRPLTMKLQNIMMSVLSWFLSVPWNFCSSTPLFQFLPIIFLIIKV